jgi:hypothetical protein
VIIKPTNLLLIVFVFAGYFFWSYLSSRLVMSLPSVRSLDRYCSMTPCVPVVFTSRSDANALVGSAIESDGLHWPGSASWKCSDGRLRLLNTNGQVHELTWGRHLPDGSSIIDVLSPSVSLDGKRILFSGRASSPGHGRWRIFEVNVDGSCLRPLTGGSDDPGCVSVPPLRYGISGSLIDERTRRVTDYDDVDPVDVGEGSFVFSSSRIPDLGRDHSRRSTQIWIWPAGSTSPHSLSANRNNDRWPFYLPGGNVVYSLWSRSREAVTEDLSELAHYSSGTKYLTLPNDDSWMGARISTNGAQFSYAIKTEEPVWRARPLFNGRLAFMTVQKSTPEVSRLAQAIWGTISSAPSSQRSGESFIKDGGASIIWGPSKDSRGQEISAGCPSPCPGNNVLFSASISNAALGSSGIYVVSDDWTVQQTPHPIFDDPEMFDSEPVAVYIRNIESTSFLPDPPIANLVRQPESLTMADGSQYKGPSGYIENLAVNDAIRSPIPWQSVFLPSGRRRDPRYDPLIPPPGIVFGVAVYSDHRDRFDDINQSRIRGGWDKQMILPVQTGGELQAWMPSDINTPVKIVGLDQFGKILHSVGTTLGSNQQPGNYYAVAGDHHTFTRANGYHYCNGCHAGHTFTSLDIRERLR